MKKNVPLSEDVLSLGWGFIDQTYNPDIIPKLTAQAIAKRGYELLQYNDSLGLPDLRNYGRIFLQKKFGIKNIEFDEIIVTNGATAGIDLATRYVLQGKYNSIALTPIYDTALESLKRNSKEVLPVELGVFEEEGGLILDWERLEELMKRADTGLIYINPNFQNPTGVVFDETTKKRLYELAKKYGVVVLEDDPYKLYDFSGQELGENLINMDEGKEHVIYLNSISKVFYPGMRIGFLIGNRRVVHEISELQKYSTSSPNLIIQGVSIEAFERGEIDNSIAHYMREISDKSSIVLKALQSRGLVGENSPIQFSQSQGGFYLWGKFRDRRNTDELSKRALQYGVSFVPGSIYGLNDEYKDSFRIAYAQIDKSRIDEAVDRFDKLVRS